MTFEQMARSVSTDSLSLPTSPAASRTSSTRITFNDIEFTRMILDKEEKCMNLLLNPVNLWLKYVKY